MKRPLLSSPIYTGGPGEERWRDGRRLSAAFPEGSAGFCHGCLMSWEVALILLFCVEVKRSLLWQTIESILFFAKKKINPHNLTLISEPRHV